MCLFYQCFSLDTTSKPNFLVILNLRYRREGSEAVAETRGYRPAFIHGISNRCRGLIARGVHGQRVKKGEDLMKDCKGSRAGTSTILDGILSYFIRKGGEVSSHAILKYPRVKANLVKCCEFVKI